MSVSSVEVINSRLEVATEDSPLALFRAKEGAIDCVFANTVASKRRMSWGDPTFAGVIHKGMGVLEVQSVIHGAMRGLFVP